MCFYLKPPDQVAAIQRHRGRHPGGVRQCTGQGVGPRRLQRHGVHQGRPVHRGHGQHQGESLLELKHAVMSFLGPQQFTTF